MIVMACRETHDIQLYQYVAVSAVIMVVVLKTVDLTAVRHLAGIGVCVLTGDRAVWPICPASDLIQPSTREGRLFQSGLKRYHASEPADVFPVEGSKVGQLC